MTMSWARLKFASANRLPPLSAGWMTLYGAVWAVFCILALAVAAYNAAHAQRPRGFAWVPLGIKTDYANTGVQTVSSEQARAAGVRAGDTVVAVDGVEIDRLGDDYGAIRASLHRPEGTPVALTLRDAHGRLITRRLPYRTVSTRTEALGQWTSRITRSLAMFVSLGASGLLFRQRRQPVAAMLALALPCMVTATLADQAFFRWFGTAHDPYVLVNLGCLLLLLALIGFPDGYLRSRAAKLLTVAAVAWEPMAVVLTLIGSERGIASYSFCALLLAAVADLSRRYRRMAGRERQQVRWALLGIAGYALMTTIYVVAVVAPPASMDPSIPEVTMEIAGMLACVCLAGGLVVSLLRYRLYDADAVIGRSAVYGVLTLGFVALFAGGEKVIEVVGERWFGEELGALAAGLGAAVAAVLIVPLHHRVSHWAEHRFQKALIRLKHELPLLASDLRETASPAAIADAALQLGVPAVHGTHGAVVAGGTTLAAHGLAFEEVDEWRAEHATVGPDTVHDLFPTRIALRAGDEAWLLLGPRPDGSPVGKDERDALVEVAGPLARALAVAGERVRRERALSAALAGIGERLAKLEMGATDGALSCVLAQIDGRLKLVEEAASANPAATPIDFAG